LALRQVDHAQLRAGAERRDPGDLVAHRRQELDRHAPAQPVLSHEAVARRSDGRLDHAALAEPHPRAVAADELHELRDGVLAGLLAAPPVQAPQVTIWALAEHAM